MLSKIDRNKLLIEFEPESAKVTQKVVEIASDLADLAEILPE